MLPQWPGANKCWTRVQNILHQMARNGHVELCSHSCSAKRRSTKQHCHVSQELRDAVDMLGRFDEEEIKYFLLIMKDRGYCPD